MALSFFGIRKRSSSGENSKRRQTSGLPEGLCRRFSLAEIRKATNGFDETLFIAEGVFADVYKGYINIDDGAMAVAIKRWRSKGSAAGERVLKADVLMLCQLRHPHIISLIGFCDDCGEMIGVYEYMSKGNLSDHLFGKDPDRLSWKKRLQICIGVARGLHYLHTGTKRAIVHRDVKPINILLDDNWVPKVSNLALSKMAPLSMSNAGLIRMESRVAVAGTNGYLDLEYSTSGYLIQKSDVYAFGVILLEILSGRKRHEWEVYYFDDSVGWAKDYNKQLFIHPYLKGKISPECFKKFVEIAESCVRDSGMERPTMGEVEASLEFALELQENADSTFESNNAGAESWYPDLPLSHLDYLFPTSTTVDHLQDKLF